MNELSYIIKSIQRDIYELLTYKKELRKFFYIESIKGTLKHKHFTAIVDEIERISIQVAYLESQKTEYNKFKELL
jgi:hypothetical protein